MNVFCGVGRLTNDPKGTQGERTYAMFGLAVPRRFKRDGQPEADFFDVICFGKSAEYVLQYLKRGARVAIVGHLQNDTYTSKDGQNVTKTRIYADDINGLESRRDSE